MSNSLISYDIPPVVYNSPVKLHSTLSGLANVLLIAQPYLAFPVFLSVLLGTPPLWLSWSIALIPLPLRFFLTGHLTRRTPFDLAIVISVAAVLLGFFVSPDRQLASQLLQTYLACVLFYYGFINNSRAGRWYWWLVAAFISLVLVFLSVWQLSGGVGKHVMFNSWIYELASGLSLSLNTYVDSNVIGASLSVIIPTLVGVALSTQRVGVRWGAGLLAALFTVILALSASGGGWIAATAGVLIVFLFHRSRIYVAAFAGLAALIGATFPVWHNASWVSTVFSVTGIVNRSHIWQSTIDSLLNHPFTGLGLGGYWTYVTDRSPLGGPHNAYLQLHADTGVIGIIALILAAIIFFKIFWWILHSDKNSPGYGIALGIAAGIISGGVHALVDVNTNVYIPMEENCLYFAVPFIWLWAALLVVVYQRLKVSEGITSG
ncbi:O-antigen ligase family protein [Chloroflexota bacterium]